MRACGFHRAAPLVRASANNGGRGWCEAVGRLAPRIRRGLWRCVIVSSLISCVAPVRRYGRFLMQLGKDEDQEMGQRWLRRAAENLRAKMSPNVTEQEAYHNR